jgi:hypothetical protein
MIEVSWVFEDEVEEVGVSPQQPTGSSDYPDAYLVSELIYLDRLVGGESPETPSFFTGSLQK